MMLSKCCAHELRLMLSAFVLYMYFIQICMPLSNYALVHVCFTSGNIISIVFGVIGFTTLSAIVAIVVCCCKGKT